MGRSEDLARGIEMAFRPESRERAGRLLADEIERAKRETLAALPGSGPGGFTAECHYNGPEEPEYLKRARATAAAVNAVLRERERQGEIGFTAAYDEAHGSAAYWRDCIEEYTARAMGALGTKAVYGHLRAEMVKVAALAVAAIEWADRRVGK